MLSLHAKGVVAAVVLGAVAGLASAAAEGTVRTAWVLGAVLAMFVATLSTSAIRCRRITYTITTRRLSIQTGLLARDLHETRLEQVQNVSVTQSLLDRLLDVGTITFDTAGGAGFDFSFRGVPEPRAITSMLDHALAQRASEGAWQLSQR